MGKKKKNKTKKVKSLTTVVKESSVSNISDSMYITEMSQSNTVYRYSTTSFDVLKREIPINDRIVETLESMLNEIRNYFDPHKDIEFVHNKTNKAFKIPYVYNEAIESIVPKYKDFYIRIDGTKRIVCNTNRHIGRCFETGRGSMKSLVTSEQENACCVVWNVCQEEANNGNDIDLTDPAVIRNIVGDIADRADVNWVGTWTKNTLTISKKIKTDGYDPKNYRASRIGSNAVNKVGRLHHKLISLYSRQFAGKGTKKDTFDPTDIIFYDIRKESDICNTLNTFIKMMSAPETSLEAYTQCLKVRESYKDFVDTGIYLPLSLKKLSEDNAGTLDRFNISDKSGGTASVTDFGIDLDDKNSISVWCRGNFCFDGRLDEDGNEITNVHELIVTMRRFGRGEVDIDVTLNQKNTPPLGKCKREIWRNVLNVPNSRKSICIKAFSEFLNNSDDNTTRDTLTTFIKSAIKQGPSCLTFYLLH